MIILFSSRSLKFSQFYYKFKGENQDILLFLIFRFWSDLDRHLDPSFQTADPYSAQKSGSAILELRLASPA